MLQLSNLEIRRFRGRVFFCTVQIGGLSSQASAYSKKSPLILESLVTGLRGSMTSSASFDFLEKKIKPSFPFAEDD